MEERNEDGVKSWQVSATKALSQIVGAAKRATAAGEETFRMGRILPGFLERFSQAIDKRGEGEDRQQEDLDDTSAGRLAVEVESQSAARNAQVTEQGEQRAMFTGTGQLLTIR